MSKKLAIKGHSTRGQEVIEILEMLGGVNSKNLDGKCNVFYFFIDNETSIGCASNFNNNNFVYFTLEEFLTQYPHKVGELKDLVDDHISCVITEIRWNEQDECVEYHAEFGSNDYGWYRAHEFCSDYQIEEHNTVISGINLNSCDYADEVELNLGNYEIEVRDGKTYAVKKKPKYPKTYKECCDVLEIPNDERYIDVDVPLDYNKIVSVFIELLMCRKAYWKIAGEEMGLDKPWEPKHDYDEEIFFIYCDRANGINKGQGFPTDNFILSFPTAEMRDAFYENFKKEIEQCKELL